MTDLKAWRLAVPPKRKRRGRVVSAHAGFLTAWLHKGFNEKVLARVKEVAQAAEGAAPTRFWVTGGWGVRGGACRGGVLGRDVPSHCPALLSVPIKCQLETLLASYPPLHAGHSLGGALAVLASLEIARQHPDSHITCYTFGCPRVGGRLGCVTGWAGAVGRCGGHSCWRRGLASIGFF